MERAITLSFKTSWYKSWRCHFGVESANGLVLVPPSSRQLARSLPSGFSFRLSIGLQIPLAELTFTRGDKSPEGGRAGPLGVADTTHRGVHCLRSEAARAGAALSPTARRGAALLPSLCSGTGR